MQEMFLIKTCWMSSVAVWFPRKNLDICQLLFFSFLMKNLEHVWCVSLRWEIEIKVFPFSFFLYAIMMFWNTLNNDQKALIIQIIITTTTSSILFKNLRV